MQIYVRGAKVPVECSLRFKVRFVDTWNEHRIYLYDEIAKGILEVGLSHHPYKINIPQTDSLFPKKFRIPPSLKIPPTLDSLGSRDRE